MSVKPLIFNLLVFETATVFFLKMKKKLTEGRRPAGHSYGKLNPFNVVALDMDSLRCHFRFRFYPMYEGVIAGNFKLQRKYRYAVSNTKLMILNHTNFCDKPWLQVNKKTSYARHSEYPSCIAALHHIELNKPYCPKVFSLAYKIY